MAQGSAVALWCAVAWCGVEAFSPRRMLPMTRAPVRTEIRLEFSAQASVDSINAGVAAFQLAQNPVDAANALAIVYEALPHDDAPPPRRMCLANLRENRGRRVTSQTADEITRLIERERERERETRPPCAYPHETPAVGARRAGAEPGDESDSQRGVQTRRLPRDRRAPRRGRALDAREPRLLQRAPLRTRSRTSRVQNSKSDTSANGPLTPVSARASTFGHTRARSTLSK